MNIYLIGYMYSGKTTVGRTLARRLQLSFADLDTMFEERYHTSIPLFFSRYGENAFRQLEKDMLHTTTTLSHTIISTGGGTPCHFDNMQWILRHGLAVYLEVSPQTILQRATASHKRRPILASLPPDRRQTFVQEQLQQRQPFYRQAHLTFPADNPDLPLLSQQIQSLLPSSQPTP